MLKRALFMLVWLSLGVMPALAQDDIATDWTCPEGFEGETLNVYNWSTYIAEDTIPNFESLCGVTIVYDVYGSSGELLDVMQNTNERYDVIFPSDFVVALLAEEGLLRELNLDNIPNVDNVDDRWLDPLYDPGNTYSLPYQWGTVGIGYNVEVVDEEITSWQQVMDYPGRVAWLEDRNAMLLIGLLMTGNPPNTTDPSEIQAARDYLLANSGNVVAIAPDDGQVLLTRGEADIVIEYSGDIFQVIDECLCDTYAYVIPEEGTNVWVDNISIPANAQNPELAEVFIDYLLDAQVGADISNYTAYATPNEAAIEAGLIDEFLLEDPGIYPVSEDLVLVPYAPEEAESSPLFEDAWEIITEAINER